MYMIQIERDDTPSFMFPTCLFPASIKIEEAEEIWQFMVDNLNPGWQVALLNAEAEVVKEAVAGDPAL